MGCGYGGLTLYTSRFLNIAETHGVDIDEERLSSSNARGILTHSVDLSKDRLPFEDKYFDIVISHGVIEHLFFIDNLLAEAFRVLSDGGYLVLSLPNLSGYVNRVALMMGYQPREVEISNRRLFGVFPFYPKHPIGHIHSFTLQACKEALSYYGFKVIRTTGLAPRVLRKEVVSHYRLFDLLTRSCDYLFARSPTLARRYIVLAEKLGSAGG